MSLSDPSDGSGGGGTGGGTGPAQPPSNSNGWQSILAYNINLLSPARVDVIVTYKQSFSNGNASWAGQLLINGTIVDDKWGQATADSITLMGSVNLPAGTYQALQLWQASSTVTLYRPRMKVSWSFK